MNRVFLVHGAGPTVEVAADFQAAVERVAYALWPRPDWRERFSQQDEFYGLDRAMSVGSFCRRVRYAAGSEGRQFQIEEHDPARPYGTGTEVEGYNLGDGVDPAFLVQRALYRASETENPLSQCADELEEEVRDALRERRRGGEDDRALLNRWRRYEQLMSGIQVIPAGGDPALVLRGLPITCRQEFEIRAAKAFPQEFAAPRP